MVTRAANVIFSVAGLIVLSPVFLILSVAIVFDSGMPVFFRQPRVGRNGRPFFLFKFRSMRSDPTGNRITRAGDARITRVGKFLRKYKLDELPQLWNVLNGDMSLVGPRPEVAAFVDLTNPVWRRVLSVRPGITDLATLLYRNEEELLAGARDVEAEYRQNILPNKLAVNLEYLGVRNPWTDLKLVFLTIWYSFAPARLNEDRIRSLLLSHQSFTNEKFL
jgi:lipopolysaccharide/colanic/teichoic acid biosynthesis glycosyltransferase